MPDDSETTMASRLRSMGWTCIEPAPKKAVVPKPNAGEIWSSPFPRVAPREVKAITSSYGGVNYSIPGINNLWCSNIAWARWVRARQATTGGATDAG